MSKPRFPLSKEYGLKPLKSSKYGSVFRADEVEKVLERIAAEIVEATEDMTEDDMDINMEEVH